MDVLLTYAERTSRRLARTLCVWLPRVLPACRVVLWAPDCERPGGRPREHQVTCICVTPEALQGTGLFYAAGAAYPDTPNGITVPVVLDLAPEDLGDTPLTVFQATSADHQGLLALATTLNGISAKPLADPQLIVSFDRLWHAFEDRLCSVPGTLQETVNVTVATESFLQTFPYGCGPKDGLWTETLVRTLDILAQPGSPVAFPHLDYKATRLFDVEHERWMVAPKLLSRVRSKHIAFVAAGASEKWGESPWLLAATIRARAAAGRSVARDSRTGDFYLAP